MGSVPAVRNPAPEAHLRGDVEALTRGAAHFLPLSLPVGGGAADEQLHGREVERKEEL